MDEAIEPFSQSRSMFLLDALLSIGNDSIEHTDPALDDTSKAQSNNYMYTQDGKRVSSTLMRHLTYVTLPLQR